MLDNKHYQRVLITLSDGSVIVYTGAVQVIQPETRTIVNIVFTDPEELPEDTYLELMQINP